MNERGRIHAHKAPFHKQLSAQAFKAGVLKLDPGGSVSVSHTCLKVSSVPSKTLISCFRCV